MKIRGAHVVVLVAAAVIGLLVYGGAKMAGKTPEKTEDNDQFLEEIRQIAPTAPSTEEGLVPPLAKADQAPKIELEPSGDIDMGVVRNDGRTNREIKVHNRGVAPLKITKITTSCGCTKATMEEKDKTIAPGAFSIMTITIDPARISGGFESRKSVTVNSNDPVTPALKFDVVVKVNPEYLLEPARVEFGTVEKGTPQEMTLLLRQLTDQPIEVKSVTPMAKAGALEVSHEIRPKEQWLDPNKPEYNIHVRLAEHVPLGQFSGRFTILTTCKRRAEVPVSVTATVNSWYSITPARMLVLRQVPATGQENQTKVVVSADRPIEIVDFQPSIEGLLAEVQPGENDNAKVIQLSLAPNAEPLGKTEYLGFSIKSGEKLMKEVLEVRIIPAAAPGRPGSPPRPLFNRRAPGPAAPPAATPPAATPPEEQPAPAPPPVPAPEPAAK